MLEKQLKRKRRHKKVRAKISGTAKEPRLCVFRSLKHIQAQLIDDEKGKTLVSASDSEISSRKRIYPVKSREAGISPKAKLFNRVNPVKSSEAGARPVKSSEAGAKQFNRVKKDLSGKLLKAYLVGELIAKKAEEKKIKKAVFDRGGYKYHGRVRALREGAQKGGLRV